MADVEERLRAMLCYRGYHSEQLLRSAVASGQLLGAKNVGSKTIRLINAALADPEIMCSLMQPPKEPYYRKRHYLRCCTQPRQTDTIDQIEHFIGSLSA